MTYILCCTNVSYYLLMFNICVGFLLLMLTWKIQIVHPGLKITEVVYMWLVLNFGKYVSLGETNSFCLMKKSSLFYFSSCHKWDPYCAYKNTRQDILSVDLRT